MRKRKFLSASLEEKRRQSRWDFILPDCFKGCLGAARNIYDSHLQLSDYSTSSSVFRPMSSQYDEQRLMCLGSGENAHYIHAYSASLAHSTVGAGTTEAPIHYLSEQEVPASQGAYDLSQQYHETISPLSWQGLYAHKYSHYRILFGTHSCYGTAINITQRNFGTPPTAGNGPYDPICIASHRLPQPQHVEVPPSPYFYCPNVSTASNWP